jgi:hypothetical protein
VCRAMLFLRECELLKIEDILPFFPDFVLIDDFKEVQSGSPRTAVVVRLLCACVRMRGGMAVLARVVNRRVRRTDTCAGVGWAP